MTRTGYDILHAADPVERIRATPHWMERIAAGKLTVQASWLTAAETATIDRLRQHIEQVRAHRQAYLRPVPAPERGPVHHVRWRGIDLCCQWRTQWGRGTRHVWWWVADAQIDPSLIARSRRDAVRRAARRRMIWRRAPLELWRRNASGERVWTLTVGGSEIARWRHCPTRREIIAGCQRYTASRRSSTTPDTMGWRAWLWRDGVLRSPHRRTPWHTPELRCDGWSDAEALRGEEGIHALRMPRDWRRADWQYSPWAMEHGMQYGGPVVTGIVERYGRYVLGTEGWRAEWVVIRGLVAPDTATALQLMAQYPDVKIHISREE